MAGRRVVADPLPALPFGVPEILAALAGAGRVLDVGCGSGRLTVALALAGASVTGLDSSRQRLDDASRRASEAGVRLELLRADMEERLPFADASFDGVASRLALMIAVDPLATLRELGRVLEPEGRVATVVWASLPENPRAPSASSETQRRSRMSTRQRASRTWRRAISARRSDEEMLPSTGSDSRRRTDISAESKPRSTKSNEVA